jgi:hypothetical protein
MQSIAMPLYEDGMAFTNSSVDHSTPKQHATGFRLWIIIISLFLAGTVAAVLLAIGVQHHNDQQLAAQMMRSEVELQTTGARISGIKDHKFKTMAEYVDAYVQVAPLLDDYDHELQEYADLCERARRRDERRSLINIMRGQKSFSSDVWRNASAIIQLVREISSVMKREASVIRDISSLPEQEQVQFWHEQFLPLLAQEHALRERLALAGRRCRRNPQPNKTRM